MKYVILRDDDTNALTPVDCLERLYRPFLDRGMPVNLATIPNVRTNVMLPDGTREGFLFARNGATPETMPMAANEGLVRYLKENPLYNIVQHGYHHDYHEFERLDHAAIVRRLEDGTRDLTEAGFAPPRTFVAPHDKFSRESIAEVARRFRVISGGWFELGRLPSAWWPNYVLKKLRRESHWEADGVRLLSHPGCLLSCHRPLETMLGRVKRSVLSRPLTVLVTHWWEYFRGGKTDEPFINVLHQTAQWLAREPGVKVISFDDVSAHPFP